jgi:oligo-alginate lyase
MIFNFIKKANSHPKPLFLCKILRGIKMKKNISFIIISLAFLVVLKAQNTLCLTNTNWQKLPEHPRLFANNARMTTLKRQKDAVTKQLLAYLKQDAERKLLKEKMVYPTKGFKFEAMREVQGRILILTLSYRIFGDKRYLERAKAELMQLAELPDWCPTHFLDVGEAALAAGIGLDWLYADLTTNEREKITQSIIKNALLPSLEAKEAADNKSWVNGNFNWNPVCHAGLSVAALAIAENEPTLARQIVERGIKNMPYSAKEYAPDGSYPEGPSYWSYGTSFYVLEIEALRTVFGTACGLDTLAGFLKTAEYKLQMVGPTGEDFNYSDYHIENLNEPIMLWFGRELGHMDWVEPELRAINQLFEGINANKKAENGKKVVANRHLPFELLWWEPSIKMNYRIFIQPYYTAKGGLPMAVMRSDWGDPKASFIALKGGTPNNSHGHIDVGSFILEADSIRWAVDLGTESYDKMRAAKLDLWNYSQNSSRWTTFRVGAEGHNIMRFNNANQDISGFATIEKLPDTVEERNPDSFGKGAVGNVLDLTSLYKSQVLSAHRTVKLYQNKSMSIEDTWKTGENPVEYAFQWLTYAKATLTDYGILLEQNGKFLKLKIETPNAEIIIEDVSQSKNIQDSPNPNLSRIVIKIKSAAKTERKFSLLVYPNGVKF